MIRKNYQTFAC